MHACIARALHRRRRRRPCRRDAARAPHPHPNRRRRLAACVASPSPWQPRSCPHPHPYPPPTRPSMSALTDATCARPPSPPTNRQADPCHYSHVQAGADWKEHDAACGWTCGGSSQSPINVPTSDRRRRRRRLPRAAAPLSCSPPQQRLRPPPPPAHAAATPFRRPCRRSCPACRSRCSAASFVMQRP